MIEQNDIMSSLIEAMDNVGFSVEAVYPDEVDGQYVVKVKYPDKVMASRVNEPVAFLDSGTIPFPTVDDHYERPAETPTAPGGGDPSTSRSHRCRHSPCRDLHATYGAGASRTIRSRP